MKPFLLYTEEWSRRSDDARMRIVVYRVAGGIRYELEANDVLEFQVFSPRPYVLGQACDGSISNCVSALFFDCCEANGLEAAAIQMEAYPDETPPASEERALIIRRGMSEGVSFPLNWDVAANRGLIESLRAINNHCLAALLESKVAVS